MSPAAPELCHLPETRCACQYGPKRALRNPEGQLCWLQGCDAAAVHEAVGQLQTTLNQFQGSVQCLMGQTSENSAQVRPLMPTRALKCALCLGL